MTHRSAIVVCAVVAVVSGLSLCQLPTPRVTIGKTSGIAFSALTATMSKDVLPAFDRVKQAVQVRNLDGLPFLDLMR